MTGTSLSMISLTGLLLTGIHVEAQRVARPIKPPDSSRKLQAFRVRVVPDLHVTGDHCDGTTTLPVRPPCPNDTPRLTANTRPPDRAQTVRMSDLFTKLGVKSSDDIMLEYVRPAGSSRLVNIMVEIYDSKASRIGSHSCDCRKELMSVAEGEAIQFTLKGAGPAATTPRTQPTGLSGEHSIAIYIGFERDQGRSQQKGVAVARSSRPI